MVNTNDLKALLGQAKKAAEQIKAQINELDSEMDELFEKRDIYLSAPLSKEDYFAAIRADIQAKSARFGAQLKRNLLGKPLDYRSFQGANEGRLGFLYLSPFSRNPYIDEDAFYYYNEDAIVAGIERALGDPAWPVDAMPAARRAVELEAISAQIEAIRAKRETMVGELLSIGVTQ